MAATLALMEDVIDSVIHRTCRFCLCPSFLLLQEVRLGFCLQPIVFASLHRMLCQP
jgi:hypothetical protein